MEPLATAGLYSYRAGAGAGWIWDWGALVTQALWFHTPYHPKRLNTILIFAGLTPQAWRLLQFPKWMQRGFFFSFFFKCANLFVNGRGTGPGSWFCFPTVLNLPFSNALTLTSFFQTAQRMKRSIKGGPLKLQLHQKPAMWPSPSPLSSPGQKWWKVSKRT